MKKSKGKLSGLVGIVTDSTPKKFERFTDLDAAPDIEPWLSIKEYYESESCTERIMGLILNGVLTNKKTDFLLSWRIINQYIENHKGKLKGALSGTTYKRVLAQLNDPRYGFLICTEQPSQGESIRKRAGTYRIIFKPALDYLEA